MIHFCLFFFLTLIPNLEIDINLYPLPTFFRYFALLNINALVFWEFPKWHSTPSLSFWWRYTQDEVFFFLLTCGFFLFWVFHHPNIRQFFYYIFTRITWELYPLHIYKPNIYYFSFSLILSYRICGDNCRSFFNFRWQVDWLGHLNIPKYKFFLSYLWLNFSENTIYAQFQFITYFPIHLCASGNLYIKKKYKRR